MYHTFRIQSLNDYDVRSKPKACQHNQTNAPYRTGHSSIQLKTLYPRQSEYPKFLSSYTTMCSPLFHQFPMEKFLRKNGWQLDGLDDGIRHPFSERSVLMVSSFPFRWASKNSKSLVVTSPPRPIPTQKSIACASLRQMKSSLRVVSGIS